MKNVETKSTKSLQTLDSILTDISAWKCSTETLTQVRTLLENKKKTAVRDIGSDSLVEKAKARKKSRTQQHVDQQITLAARSTREHLGCAVKIIKTCLVALTHTSNASKSEKLSSSSADRAATQPRSRSQKPLGQSATLQVITDCCVIAFEAWTLQIDDTKRLDLAMARSNFITRLQEHQLVPLRKSQAHF